MLRNLWQAMGWTVGDRRRTVGHGTVGDRGENVAFGLELSSRVALRQKPSSTDQAVPKIAEEMGDGGELSRHHEAAPVAENPRDPQRTGGGGGAAGTGLWRHRRHDGEGPTGRGVKTERPNGWLSGSLNHQQDFLQTHLGGFEVPSVHLFHLSQLDRNRSSKDMFEKAQSVGASNSPVKIIWIPKK